MDLLKMNIFRYYPALNWSRTVPVKPLMGIGLNLRQDVSRHRHQFEKKKNAKRAYARHKQRKPSGREAPLALLLSQLETEASPEFKTVGKIASSLIHSGGDVAAEDLIMLKQLKSLGRERSIYNRLDAQCDAVERARRDAPAIVHRRQVLYGKAHDLKYLEVARTLQKKEADDRMMAEHQECIRLAKEYFRTKHSPSQRLHMRRPSYIIKVSRGLDAIRRSKRLERMAPLLTEETTKARRKEQKKAEECKRGGAIDARRDRDQAGPKNVHRAHESAEAARRRLEEAQFLARHQEEAPCFQEKREIPQADEEKQAFQLYDLKWTVLKSDEHIPVIYFYEIPWPLIHPPQSFDDFHAAAIKEFVLHPRRDSLAGKCPRERIKLELLNWHPDKFNARVLPRIFPDHAEPARNVAGNVVKILTELLKSYAN